MLRLAAKPAASDNANVLTILPAKCMEIGETVKQVRMASFIPIQISTAFYTWVAKFILMSKVTPMYLISLVNSIVFPSRKIGPILFSL